MKNVLKKQSEDLQAALQDLTKFHEQIEAVAKHLQEAFDKDHTVFVAGNGGSAAEAQHLSDEMVGRYKNNRRPYPVIALTADGAVLTCIGNDFGYEHVFARQVQALGKEGDIFIGLSTSGNSKNILLAMEMAHEKGMTTIALTGLSGKMREIADHVIESPSESNPRVQELHLHAIHLLCEFFEE